MYVSTEYKEDVSFEFLKESGAKMHSQAQVTLTMQAVILQDLSQVQLLVMDL